ncbi:MAG: hypothetical protein AB1918_19305 [Pseudomonadota bacterium]
MSDGTAASRMAQVMADKVVECGSCTRDDLRRAGFSAAQIDRHADAAREQATRLLGSRGLSEMWVGDHVAA